MDRYYTDVDPSNRRYSEKELREIRERYLGEWEVQSDEGAYNGTGWLDSAWRAALSLPAKMGLVEGVTK